MLETSCSLHTFFPSTQNRLRARQLAFDAPTGLIWSLPTVPKIHLIPITKHHCTIGKNLDFVKLFGKGLSGFNQTLVNQML